jgi:hypothetical protein
MVPSPASSVILKHKLLFLFLLLFLLSSTGKKCGSDTVSTLETHATNGNSAAGTPERPFRNQ